MTITMTDIMLFTMGDDDFDCDDEVAQRTLPLGMLEGGVAL